MNANELRAYIDAHFTKTLFRLETLPAYGVPSEGSDFARYLAGEPGPTPERRQQWLSRLADEVARGRRRRRVHAVDLPLSDYLRFECEWSYAGNPWEEIRILEPSADRPIVSVRIAIWRSVSPHLLANRVRSGKMITKSDYSPA